MRQVVSEAVKCPFEVGGGKAHGVPVAEKSATHTAIPPCGEFYVLSDFLKRPNDELDELVGNAECALIVRATDGGLKKKASSL
jgi:hypothetical protein